MTVWNEGDEVRETPRKQLRKRNKRQQGRTIEEWLFLIFRIVLAILFLKVLWEVVRHHL